MRSLIPNSFTCANLTCGVFSILKTIEKDFTFAGILIILALVADAFDGRTARALGVSGPFGVELDSLSDVVSFGVAPAILMHQMYFNDFSVLSLVAVAVFPICAELRLARFNISKSVVEGYFMGVPSPAGGCFLATFAIANITVQKEIVAIGVIIAGLLMYSSIRYPDFKGKGNPLKKIPAISGILIALFMLYKLPLIAIPFIFFFAYIVTGLINFVYVLATGGYD